MNRITQARPSPAMVVAVVALVAALAGTALANPTADTSALSKKKVKKITTTQINKLAPGLSVASAETADASNTLGGRPPEFYETVSASDERTSSVGLSTSNQVVLSTPITLPSRRTITAVASVEGTSPNGSTDDDMTCNLDIGPGIDGVRQTVDVLDGPNNADTLPLTQARNVNAGTHTVRVECSDDGSSNTEVEDRSLSVVASG